MTYELHSTTVKILTLLNDGHVHSGTEMASALGISRTAVWKVIQRLKKHGISLESQHQGYLLKDPLVLFNKDQILRDLKDPSLPLEIFETLPSTNDYLKNKPTLEARQICLAEHQTKGRGRMGRHWASPFGRNIYCSVSYLLNRDISELSGLSLVVGILTAKALQSVDERIDPKLKWPNDIYSHGKKVGGILIDIIAEANGGCRVVIGIGINVNMKNVPLEDVAHPWSSLEKSLGKKLDRNDVVVPLLRTLYIGLDHFLEEGMTPFLTQWKSYDLLENKEISIQKGDTVFQGRAKGITPQGHLLVELSSGELAPFSFGDTHLLKESL